MQTIKIYSPAGVLVTEVTPDKNCLRRFSLMQQDCVVLKFRNREALRFPVGSRISIGEDDFFITAPQPGKWEAATGVWLYELTFEAYYRAWANKMLRYVTPGVDSAAETSFSLTATIDVHAAMLKNCLDWLGMSHGGSPFRVQTDETVAGAEAKLVTYENLSVLGGIQAIAQAFECEWWVDGSAVCFGRMERERADLRFEAGVNVSSITFQASSTAAPNRLYVFGSDRNLPPDYRATDSADTIGGVVNRRLMLPSGTPYLQTRPDLPEDEVVEQVVVLEDVYPRTGLTIVGEPEVYEAEAEQADGSVVSEKFYRLRYGSGFRFSSAYLLPDEELHIVFRSGLLNGMDFGARFNPKGFNEKNADGSWYEDAQMIEVVANEDYGRKLPDAILRPQEGDEFILYGWDATKMADLGLVDDAEQELLEEGRKALEEYSKDLSSCTCPMAWDYIKALTAEGRQPRPGDSVTIIDTEHFGSEGRKSRIIGYEYPLDMPYAATTYTCGEAVSERRLDSMERKIDGLARSGQKVQIQNSLDFLSKRYADRTPYRLSSDTAFEAGNFVGGVSGGILGIDKGTGKSFAEVDDLWVRCKAYFESLTVIESETLAGRQYITPGGSVKCVAVRDASGKVKHEAVVAVDSKGNELPSLTDKSAAAYRCYYLEEQAGEKSETKIIAGDQAISRTFNVPSGSTGQVTNHYWWRLVTKVVNAAYTDIDTGNVYGYIEVSASDCDGASEYFSEAGIARCDIPAEGDVIAQLGCRDKDKPARQSAIVLDTVGSDAPSIKLFQGINSFSLAGKDVVSFGYDHAAGRAYFRSYGDSFMGDRTLNGAYIDFNQEHAQLTVKGKIVASSPIVDEDGKKAGTVADLMKTSVASTAVYFLTQEESAASPAKPTSLSGATAAGWSTASPDWNAEKAIWQTVYTKYTDDSVAFSEPVRISGANGQPGAQGQPGDDGKSVTAMYAKSTSTTKEPTSGWQATPPTLLAGEYMWMRIDTYDPATGKTSQGTAVRLTGDRGMSGSDVYMLDLDNEVIAVACDKDGNPVGGVNEVVSAVVYKGAALDTGWRFEINAAGATATVSGNTIRITGISADKASVKVTATKTVNGATMTLTATVSLYKVKPGQTGQTGAKGDAAVVYSIEPSAQAVTRSLDGNANPSILTCSVYQTTGDSPRSLFAVSNAAEFALTYQIVKTDGSTVSGTYTKAVTVTPDTAAIIFELYKGTDLLDRERIPVVADGADMPVIKSDLADAQDWIKKNASELEALEGTLATYDYIKAAIKDGTTTTNGGLLLSSLIKVGSWLSTDPENPVMKAVLAGMNGIPNAKGNAIMIWGGGDMVDRYLNPDGTVRTPPLTTGYAAFALRMDGSAYFSGGNIRFNPDYSARFGDAEHGLEITPQGGIKLGSGVTFDVANSDGLNMTLSSLAEFNLGLSRFLVPWGYTDEDADTTPRELTWQDAALKSTTVLGLKTKEVGFFSESFLSARGASTGSSGGSGTGGSGYGLYTDWANKILATDALSAKLGKELRDDLASLQSSLGNYVKKAGDVMTGALTATNFIKSGGTSAQFLKADGSVDSNVYLTTHQKIYALTFQAGTFSTKTFTANSAAATVNIPTTTSHISEGTNKYYTDARVTAAMASTVAALNTAIAKKLDITTFNEFKALFDSMFVKESDGNGGYRIKAKYGLYTSQFLSSRGLSTASGGSGTGSGYGLYTDKTWATKILATDALAASVGKALRDDLTALTGRVKTAEGSLTSLQSSLSNATGDINTLQNSLGNYVKKAGDTMTGKLMFGSSQKAGIYNSNDYLVLSGGDGRGKVAIGTTEVRRSSAVENLDLGTTTYRWRNLYAAGADFEGTSGTVNINNGLLTLQGGADNKLIFNNTDGDNCSFISFRQNGTAYSSIQAWSTRFQFSLYLHAPRYISTVGTGTAPLQVASTTAVTNLNADMVDGLHASSISHYMAVATVENWTDYVILLWKLDTEGYRRLDGKIITSAIGGGRYATADADLWFGRLKDGYESHYKFISTAGKRGRFRLVTCTYKGVKYLAIQSTGTLSTTFHLMGTQSGVLWQVIPYRKQAYTYPAGVSHAEEILDAEIKGSIAVVNTLETAYHGSILPDTNLGYNLGSSTYRWGTVYAKTLNATDLALSSSITRTINGTARNVMQIVTTAATSTTPEINQMVFGEASVWAMLRGGEISFQNETGNTVVKIRENKVGIGTTTPDALLHVNGNIKIEGSIKAIDSIFMTGASRYIYGVQDIRMSRNLMFLRDGASSGYYISPDVDGKLRFLTIDGNWSWVKNVAAFDSIGRFGIGTLSPSYLLHVNGYAAATRFCIPGSASSNAYISSDTATNAYLNAGGSTLTVWDGSAKVVRPSTAMKGAVDLGSASICWRSLYLTTSVKIGDATISWDSTAKALKVDKPFYSTSAVSARGISTDSGGSSSGSGSGSGYGLYTDKSWATTILATDALSAKLGEELRDLILGVDTTATANAAAITALTGRVGTAESAISSLQSSVANCVTLNTDQTITSTKTFSGTSSGIVMPYSPGSWISMATRLHQLRGATKNSTNSAHSLFMLKNSNGSAIAFGGLGVNIGFYGFSAEKIASNTNERQWHTYWNVDTGALTHSSSITALSFIKSGGTSAQFLKADGSVDSNTYLTTSTAASTYVTALGTSGNQLTWTKNGTVNGITVPYATTANAANKLNRNATPPTGYELGYYAGQPTTVTDAASTTVGAAYAGSSAKANLWSFPAGKTGTNTNTETQITTANVMAIRLGWSSTFFHDIFASPNYEGLWHRAVIAGKAKDWHQLAYIDSTVAAAEKLATARTINQTAFDGTEAIVTKIWGTSRKLWGQSCNGGADISGAISNAGYITPITSGQYGIGSSTMLWGHIYLYDRLHIRPTEADMTANGTTVSRGVYIGRAQLGKVDPGVSTDADNGKTVYGVGMDIYLERGNSQNALMMRFTQQHRIGVFNGSPEYPLDITGETRITATSTALLLKSGGTRVTDMTAGLAANGALNVQLASSSNTLLLGAYLPGTSATSNTRKFMMDFHHGPDYLNFRWGGSIAAQFTGSSTRFYGTLTIGPSTGGATLRYDTTTAGLECSTGFYTPKYLSSRGIDTTSDARLKTRISGIALTIHDIARAPLWIFRWRDTGEQDSGSVAQYWERILPHVVRERETKTLDYGKAALISVVTAAREIARHDREIAQLRQENRQLRRRIARLEKAEQV